MQEKSGCFPYKAARDSIDPRITVDSQPQYEVVFFAGGGGMGMGLPSFLLVVGGAATKFLLGATEIWKLLKLWTT